MEKKAVQTVERLRFNRPSESDVLWKQVRQHNEAFEGRGLKFLRSFLLNVSKIPEFSASIKPLVTALNGKNIAQDAVKEARLLLAQSYSSAGEQFIASQAALFVRKYPFKGSDALAEAAGTRKFLLGERRNSLMNRILRRRRSNCSDIVLVSKVRKHLARILGPEPDHRKAGEYTGWGPGANVGVSGQFTNFARKLLTEKWTVTRTALPYVLSAARRSPMFWELLGFTQQYKEMTPELLLSSVNVKEFDSRFLARCVFVDHNVIAFVQKNADEHRTIAKEPLLNSWIQKGYDMEMRLRLKRFGIDLRHQEPNQEMAREGSLGGFNSRCTIDLTNASGSIAAELPRTLCTFEWFETLNAIRSPAYCMPGKEEEQSTRYSGFVSMGNGTCFPLQTAIFAAICMTAHEMCGTDPDFRCYGDDIIVRQNEALLVLELLRHFGFAANSDKTFILGPFRESCGADWHTGEDVRPIYFDTPLDTIEQRVRLHNALCRLPNRWAQPLANAMLCTLPPFMNKFVRPFADCTDEAIDGRFMHWVGPYGMYTRNFESPAWYGFSYEPTRDEEIESHASFNVALVNGALAGSDSKQPFTARRETRVRVARFSHSGNTSNWLPMPQERYPFLSALVGHLFSVSTTALAYH